MSEPFSAPRRAALAAAALALSAALLRGPLASALVLRGDDYLYAGDRAAAMVRYARALMLAPDFELAADRYAFVALLVRTPQSLSAGARVASRVLRLHPSATLYHDRALCFLAMRQYGAAYDDFTRAAALNPTPQSVTFAGWAALRIGRRRAALALWRQAAARWPRFTPARLALTQVTASRSSR